ncbi:MAG: sensor histidine kinase [Phycisphaerales bacterium]|nr:sensor histidine kinase [Hyphomonadaceae bacterium]
MRLAAFIRSNESAIIAAWEEFAQTYLPSAAHMDRVALRDHIVGLLRFIADDLETPQTERERSEKAKGQSPKDKGADDSAAETHADLRFTGGFDTVEMASEFRALRASVTKLWRAAWDEPVEVIPDLLRFNESMDQVMTESLARYTRKLNYGGALFIGSLVNDFRSSLTTVSNSAQALTDGKLDHRQAQLVSQIKAGASHVDLLISDMIDAARVRSGEGVPIALAPMDIADTVKDAAKEFGSAHPDRKIVVETAGNLEGKWDRARIRQMLSILIGSAMQYELKASEIAVAAKAGDHDVILSVHSEGVIPPDAVATVFDPLARWQEENAAQSGETRLKLGLYIAKGIVTAHGGKITVASNETQGTTFSAQFPRQSA